MHEAKILFFHLKVFYGDDTGLWNFGVQKIGNLSSFL